MPSALFPTPSAWHIERKTQPAATLILDRFPFCGKASRCFRGCIWGQSGVLQEFHKAYMLDIGGHLMWGPNDYQCHEEVPYTIIIPGPYLLNPFPQDCVQKA